MARRLRSRRFSGAGLNNTPYTSDIIQKNEDMLGGIEFIKDIVSREKENFERSDHNGEC